MRKIIFALGILLVLGACQQQEAVEEPKLIEESPSATWEISDLQPASELTVNPDLEGAVTMSIGERQGGRLAVVIKNGTEFELMSGDSYTLEFLYDGQWLVVPFSHGGEFTSEGFSIYPDSERLFLKPIWSDFEFLQSGTYRLRKSVLIDGAGLEREHELVAELWIAHFMISEES